MSQQFIPIEFKGREYIAYFQPGASAPFEIVTWTTPASGRSRSMRQVWAMRRGEPQGRAAEVYAIARAKAAEADQA